MSISDNTLNERYSHLLDIMMSDRFLKMQGLGKEVPFFICPYDAKESIQAQQMQKQLINKLAQSGIKVLNVNLYELSIDILNIDDDWQWYIDHEESMAKDELLSQLQSILDVESVLTPAIAKRIQEDAYHIVFLSGVGEVFPYIRSHQILNNLQSVIKNVPMVMFFPGEYKHSLELGSSLELFGKLHDDNYYRAFNINEYKV
ncbi:MAG: DUF1788 domain-containing protein [candidate division Zixibacteria bacterium]|nr:DUF1788 domain-containing protein [candidate division Zixibacteria bacterium]